MIRKLFLFLLCGITANAEIVRVPGANGLYGHFQDTNSGLYRLYLRRDCALPMAADLRVGGHDLTGVTIINATDVQGGTHTIGAGATFSILDDSILAKYADTSLIKIATGTGDLSVASQYKFIADSYGDKITFYSTLYKVAVSALDLDSYSEQYFRWHSDSNADAMVLDADSGNLTLEGTLTSSNSPNWDNAYAERGSVIAGNYLSWSGGQLNVSDSWWDSVGDVPTATPSNGDTTHLSTAGQIYSFVGSLGAVTNPLTADLDVAGYNIDNVSKITMYSSNKILFIDNDNNLVMQLHNVDFGETAFGFTFYNQDGAAMSMCNNEIDAQSPYIYFYEQAIFNESCTFNELSTFSDEIHLSTSFINSGYGLSVGRSVATASGYVDAQGGYLTKGADFGEYFYCKNLLLRERKESIGIVVTNDSSWPKGVRPALNEYDFIVGVITEEGSGFYGDTSCSGDRLSVPVGMLGKVPCKVAHDEDIKMGDYLGVRFGRVIKKSKTGRVIGVALEDQTNDGFVLALIQPQTFPDKNQERDIESRLRAVESFLWGR